MKFKITFLLAIFLILSAGCSVEPDTRIAISRGSNSPGYEKYEEWINSIDPEIECIDMYELDKDQAVRMLETCSGLILSGGPDVHPSNFGEGHDTSRCSIDEWRDTLEFALIKKAKEMKMPVLGICRGMQILNVAYGGSLIIDIPEDTDSEITHQYKNKDEDAEHLINVLEGTYLHHLTGVKAGKVNSNHHQAVKELAGAFKATAFTKDSIIEAMEFKNHKERPFLIGVQWHPERLEITHDLSRPIADEFLYEVDEYKKHFTRLNKPRKE